MKTPRQLERYFKGVANHRRIQILMVVEQRPDISLEAIAEELEANFKTISEHTKRLAQAGLINKHYQGRTVIHRVTPYGKRFLEFIANL